jgi:uncharacterized protein (TIGR03435 family)
MMAALTNHVWQSTLFAAAAGLVVLALQRNRAQVRYWVWFSASCKFLVPFALLMALGRLAPVRPSKPIATPPLVSFAVEQIAQPFPETPPILPAARRSIDWLPIVWACGFAAVVWVRFRGWLRARAAVSASTPVDIPANVAVRSSPGLLEPGVVGLWHPTLLLPEGIAERLTPPQLEAVLAHELCHVRRRDNLFAAIHMAVEALFWFHPLVWWIGARLVEERERACDEEVLRLGSAPHDYAEAILSVCKHYVESPLVCVSGVTGADLKRRVEGIMSNRLELDLSLTRKVSLVVSGLLALAAPIVVGMISGPSVLTAQSSPAFAVASVKAHKPGDPQKMQFLPSGRFSMEGAPLQVVIATAYGLPFQSSRLSGGPNWIRDSGSAFDIEAKADDGALSGLSRSAREAKMRLMLQALLADRFKLVIRRDTREEPVYALVVAKNGPKLQKAKVDEKYCFDHPAEAVNQCHQIGASPARGIHSTAVDMSDLVWVIGSLADRPVLDRTGLDGLYDIQTDGWEPLRQTPLRPPGTDPGADAGSSDPNRPTLFMIFEKLGLKLEPSRAGVETFVIDHVERPSGN